MVLMVVLFVHCNVKEKLILNLKNNVLKILNLYIGSRYDYSKVIYKRWDINVTIGCKYHGDFEQEPNVHYQGSGCPDCARILCSRYGGMTNLKCKEQEVIFYFIKFTSQDHTFVKIGVTSQTIKQRFKSSSYKKYSLEIIRSLKLPAYLAVQMESDLMLAFIKDRFNISKKDAFKGSTEIFNLECYDYLLKEIDGYNRTYKE